MSAFQWVAESNNVDAITNLVNSFVKVGKKYKKDGGADASINFLRQIQYLQKNSTNSNKKELEGIVRAGMAQLVN